MSNYINLFCHIFVHGAGCVMGYLGGLLFLMLTLIHFADNVPVTKLILPALYFFGALGLIVALLVIATTFRARIQYRKTLYISEPELLYDQPHRPNTDYGQ